MILIKQRSSRTMHNRCYKIAQHIFFFNFRKSAFILLIEEKPLKEFCGAELGPSTFKVVEYEY